MKIIKLALSICFAVLLCSCSTIINKTTQEISINSNPTSARLSIDGKKFGTTPQVVNIDRGMNHVLKLEVPGYEPYEIQITTQMSSWVWLNVFNGFIPGFTIDYLNGSMYNLFPTSVDVGLIQLPPPPEPPVKKK